MGWKDLLGQGDEKRVLPWTGGRTLSSGDRSWKLEGRQPREHGWYEFHLVRRVARLASDAPTPAGELDHRVRGYLVGDRLVADGTDSRVSDLTAAGERVFLVEPGLDMFARVIAGRTSHTGPLIFDSIDMPLGPEDEVLQAFLDRRGSVDDVKGVTPGLDAAFRLETRRRAEEERRRAELEQRRREEEEKRRREEERERLLKGFGDGMARRELARVDFHEAARRALLVAGAELLDARESAQRGEMVVRFRLDGRRYECTCERETMRIVDAGICLTAHWDDPDFEEGTKGDSFFTLESLPSVIREADSTGRLVVYRQVR